MAEFIEVRTTIDTIEGAQKIANALVESRIKELPRKLEGTLQIRWTSI